MSTLDELTKRKQELETRIEAQKKESNLEAEAAAVQAAIEKENKRLADERAAAVKRFDELQAAGEKQIETLLADVWALMKKIIAFRDLVNEQRRIQAIHKLHSGLESTTGVNQLVGLLAPGRQVGHQLYLLGVLSKQNDKRGMTWGRKFRELFGVS